jgi:uncharacterized protein YkwD
MPATKAIVLRALSTFSLLLLCLLSTRPTQAQTDGPPPQTPDQVYNEMRTVYLGNLARRDNGLPPLRWNARLTGAARWFSWDSVANRPPDYCGHQDTLGGWPSDRALSYGYRGFAGAENCFCGYVTPEYAIQGWMNSGGHRANLLDPNSREVGLGYYLRASDGRGYVTQGFGQDPAYPPVVIEREALATTTPDVDLYIYDRDGGGGFAGLGSANQMKLSNDRCFTGAAWEPYAPERSWTMAPGTGWRTVFVQTRDAVGRSTVVNDTIYVGPDLPRDELGLQLAATNTDQVTLYRLNDAWSHVQLSQNWFVDDTFGTFERWWGNGERVSDSAARGGSAFRLSPGDGESFAWVWTTEFFKGTPLVAYARLKVNDNSSSDPVARFSVKGGGVEYGPLILKGTDFVAPNTYQEFPVPFTYHDDAEEVFLVFNFWRSGQADLYVDGVYIFTAPQPLASPFTWTVPGGNYRGSGVWVRYSDGTGGFSPLQEADLTPESLQVSSATLAFVGEAGGPPPPVNTLAVGQAGCEPFSWSASADAAWLDLQAVGDVLQVGVDTSGLPTGVYEATLTVTAEPGILDSPARIPVRLVLVDQVHRTYLPLVLGARAP